MTGTTSRALVAALVLSSAAAPPALADAVADFYSGKQVTVIVNAGAGGLNGLYASTVAEHLGNHVPGHPKIVMQYVPGGGGTKGANYCYNIAARNGTALCHLLMATAQTQLLGTTGVKYDTAKFTWIGRTTSENSVVYVWHTEPVKSLLDVRQHEVVIGATGKGSESYTDPTIINHVLGTKFKIILGYRGGADLDLALERQEIKGQSGPAIAVFTRKPQWIAQKQIRFLYQSGLKANPRLADVPLLISFAQNEADRQMFEFLSSRADIGRTYCGPPGMPADRTAALRAAFADTMKDPAFLADAKKRRLDVIPQTAEEVEAMIRKVLATPPSVIERTKLALGLK